MGFAAAEGTTDPPGVRNWTIHYIALVASMAALSMGYDTAVIGGTMSLDSFVRDYGIDNMTPSERDNSQANIASMFQVGAFFGALLTFPVAEKYGRKRAIMTAALVFCVGGAMMSGANGMLELVYAGRAIGGLGIGMATMTVPVYIAETSPPSIRGRLVGVFEIFPQGGGMLGFWINYATYRTIDERERAQWIVPLALQLLSAVLLFFGIMFCPESPRWLARGDDFEAAEKVLVNIRGLPADDPYVQNEMREIRQQVEERSTMRLSKKQQFRKLLAPGTRNRVVVGAFLMFLQSFTGVNIMTYFSPRIFETLGIVGTSNKLFSTGIYGVAKMLGMILFAVWVVEKLSGWGYFAMVCIYLHSFIICATIQGITWTYAAEIFPLDVRMFCVAISTASTWLGSFVVARATPFMITDLGYGTYFMFAGFLIGIGLWSFFCVPETKGVSLEEMDALFSRPTHIAVWAQLRGRPILPQDNISVAGSMDKNDAKVDEVA
ncbi:putative quinate permease [Colletotrichum viniferum]|nr:putative quinate permease [Colletotrichum viniferum]